MSVHWSGEEQRAAGWTPYDTRVSRLLGKPAPEGAQAYIDKPRSWLAEQLAEADATEALNLQEISRLQREKDAIGEDLMRQKCRIQELEQELERDEEPGRLEPVSAFILAVFLVCLAVCAAAEIARHL